MLHILKTENRTYCMESLYRQLGISRQVIFAYKVRQEEEEEKERRIIEIVMEWRKNHSKMGSRSLYYSITNAGGIDLGIGVTKFEKLMSKAGMTIDIRKKKWIKTSDGLGKSNYPNLINGLELNGINQLIVGDITYYKIGDCTYYIFTLKDVYSQRILGLVPAKSLEGKHAYGCLTQALEQRKAQKLRGCIHHSDNGSQYNATKYVNKLLDVGMKISRAKNCVENGSAEHLNGLVKNMYLDPWEINTFTELQEACKKLVLLNNEQRAITQLGNLSPVQFEIVIESIAISERPVKKLFNFDDNK